MLLCSMGCFAHILVLTLQYMKYDISTSVEIMFEDIIHLPSITLCASIVALLNWDDERLQEKCVEITGDDSCLSMTGTEIERKITRNFTLGERDVASQTIMSYFSIADILANLTIGVDGFLLAHYRHNTKEGTVDAVFDEASATFRVKEMILVNDKCYTLSWKEEWAHPDYWDMRRHRKSKGLFTFFRINKQKTRTIQWLLLSYGENNATNRFGSFDQMFLNAVGYTLSTFELIKSQFLPAPFPTKCRDYKQSGGLDNRGGCYETCFAETAWITFQMKPQPVRMEVDDHNKSMTSKFMDANSVALRALSEPCKKACAFQDCKQNVYTTIPKSTLRKKASEYVSHGFAIPTSPVVVTISTAKITFAGFGTDISSTLGFWLGLSVLSIMKWSKRMFCKLFRNTGSSKNGNRKKECIPTEIRRWPIRNRNSSRNERHGDRDSESYQQNRENNEQSSAAKRFH